MVKEIKLGYEIGTGKVVGIKPSHLIVTGLSQLSGKTTTLEALTSRSGLRAIIFKTKVGERSFSQGTEAPPFFRDRSDYEFVKSLIEAYSREKLFLEKGTLMRLCKGSASLIDIKKRVDDEMAAGKLRGLNQEIYTRLQHYLGELIPQIQYAAFSNTLQLVKSQIGGDEVKPSFEEYGPEFNLRISRSRNYPEEAWIVGSYPFVWNEEHQNTDKRRGSFSVVKGQESFLETED